ncbi:MAG: HNH endonuclease [Treponema sp.]|nr:HNH endonuclease [Treponema sp.]
MGTEIIDENGYVKVKTRNPKTWKFKQRLIWEKAYGKIPRNRMVIFADGNRLNFALDNLLLVSRAEHAVMNRWDLRSAHGELTRAGLAVADLKMAIAGRKRGVKKKKRGNK